jgi:glutaredoxin-like protein NrdH
MTVTVYSKPNCVQCEQTKRYLDNHNIAYSTVDLTQDQEALEMVVGMGYGSAPVVITDTDSWSGFRLEKLHALKITKTHESRVV